ncbi:MAG: hypothetical protein IKJ89_02070 [Kiritimatiellae bacterium]|nr:hypothetical protein [Kiritimatiellia bacterium]
MMKLRERLLKSAICLVAAVVVVPTMADDTAFALDQKRLSLDLVLPDAAGAFPTNANPYWEKVSRAEFTNVLERISKMTRLKDLSLGVHAESKVPLDLSFLSSQTNMTELCLGGNLHIGSFRKIAHLPLERLDGRYYFESSVSLADEDSLGLLKSLKSFSAWKDFRAIEKLPTSLVSLDMSHSPEGDYCGCFTNLVNLEELEMDTIFRKDQYIDEDDIRAMTKLKRLVLNGGYELGNLGVLRECKSLENLEIAFCESRPLDLSVLNGLPIKELRLKSCLVHEVKGLEKCPLKKISIDFCPIASLDDFGLFPNVRIVELRRTGIRSADRDAVLRHFPRIWSLLYGDLIEGFCDGDRCNEVVCFGPTNIVFAAGGDKSKGLSFMGFDMDSSIVYDDEVFSISEVIGMSNCVSDKRYESVIGLGRTFHGFTTVKLVGREVEIVGDEAYDGQVDSLEFEQEDEGAVFDFPSEKKWAMELAAEMERVYGATFCWDDNDEPATFLIVKGKSDAFDFVIASCAGSSETHCGTGDEVSITRREYRNRQFYVSRRGSAESAPEQPGTAPTEPL